MKNLDEKQIITILYNIAYGNITPIHGLNQIKHLIDATAEANANAVLGDVAATDLRCCGNCSNHTCIIIDINPQNELCRLEFKSDKPRKHRISNEVCSEWIYDGIKHNERLIEYKSHIT